MQLNLYTPINTLGYGYAGLNIYKALVRAGVAVSLFPINPKIEAAPADHEIIQDGIDNAKFFNPDAPCVKIWHQHDMSAFIGRGRHIGFPIFELDTFSDLEKHQLSSCDEWMVCSEWAKHILSMELGDLENEKSDEEYIRDIGSFTTVVPLGVDTEIFKPNGFPNSGYKTIFLNIGKWEVRKGHDVLVDMFNRAFTESDDVELWMMCDNCFNTAEDNAYWEGIYLNSKMGLANKIKLIPRQVTQQDVVRIMNKADIGIFPTRAEGWNLEPLEMMACGKHIITTDYSGHTEYCSLDNSKSIPITGLEDAFDGKWFFNQGKWAYLNQAVINSFVNEMQLFHVMKQNGALGVNTVGLTTANKFSWDNSAEKLLGVI